MYFQITIELKTCVECQKEFQSKVGFSRTRHRKTHHLQKKNLTCSSENRTNNKKRSN